MVGCVKGSQHVLHVRDTETGTVVAELPLLSTVDACAWHPDGRIVAVAYQRKIHIWDVDAKRELRVLEGHTNGGIMPAFDRNGERLLSNDWSGILRVWDWRIGRQVLKISAGGHNHARLVAADGRIFTFSADSQRMKILRFSPGVERQPFAVPHTPAFYMKADPAGRFAVVTQNKDGWFGRPVVTDLARGEEHGRLPIRLSGQRVFHVATDGAILSNGSSGLVRWPLTADPNAKTLRFGPPERVAGYTHGDTYSASANGRVISVPFYGNGAISLRADRAWGGVPLGPQHDVRNTAVSPNGLFVVTGTHSSSTQVGVKVWDAKTGARVAELKDPGRTAIFSPDGLWLAKWGGWFPALANRRLDARPASAGTGVDSWLRLLPR